MEDGKCEWGDNRRLLGGKSIVCTPDYEANCMVVSLVVLLFCVHKKHNHSFLVHRSTEVDCQVCDNPIWSSLTLTHHRYVTN